MLLKSLVIEGVEVRVQMRRNARRITMHVRPPEGRVSIIAPFGTAKYKIVETLQEFWPQLKAYREEILAKYEQEAPSRGMEGDGERIWDREYSLRFRALTEEVASEATEELAGYEASRSTADRRTTVEQLVGAAARRMAYDQAEDAAVAPLVYIWRHNRGKHPRPIKAVLRCEGEDLVFYHGGDAPPAEEAVKVIDRFLDELLLRETMVEIEHYGQIMGCFHKVKTVVVKHFKSRWGHCKPLVGEVMVNGRLVRLPRHCLSYIVVHELCHFTFLGHGKNFYELQERYYPQWKESRKALQLYPLRKKD